MEIETLDTPVIEYINELKAGYEHQIQELHSRYENQVNKINKLKNNAIEYQNKYLEIKERYDLLIYKRFMRSAEQIPQDENQPSLFTEEAEPEKTTEQEEVQECTEIKSHSRKKRGRRPLDPNLPRVERIIDIPETEKTCVCGAELSKIGEESNEKLHIIPPRMYVEKTIRPKYACRC